MSAITEITLQNLPIPEVNQPFNESSRANDQTIPTPQQQMPVAMVQGLQ